MADIRKSYVDISGGQLHVRRIAAAAPAAVFLHQTASSGEMWAKVMDRLAGRWDLIALDTPGFGGSFDPDPDSEPSLDDYVGWIGAALDALGITRCHLVGHHTGSAIAVQLADEGVIELDEALTRVSGAQLAQLMFPRFDLSGEPQAITRGAG